MKKILVVEDERILRDALVEKFSKNGYEVTEADNGKSGLQMILKNRPDLILLDIVMPVMDGISMLKKLRANESGKDIKVLILTNLSDGENLAEAIDNDSQEYLIKSNWTLDDILEKVNNLT